MFCTVYLFACFLVIVSKGAEAARILAVIPTPSISHQVVFRPLTQDLAKRGHEVVVITTDPAFPKEKTPANLTEIDVHDISYKIWRDYFLTTAKGNKNDLYTQIEVALDLFVLIFEKQINTNEVQKLIKEKNNYFDLLLIESCFRPALGLSHVFKVPIILISSLGAVFDNYDIIGAPSHSLYYPSMTRQRLYNLTWWEKVTEMYVHFSIHRLLYKHEAIENEQLKKLFGADTPPLSELSNNVDMLFLNVHPIWEGNQPVPPAVIYMGGIHKKPNKELPKDLKSFLDTSVNGVIYMSFGTNTSPSMLPPEKIQLFVNVFSQLPYDILWKWDKDELPGRTENIKISNWFPQSDLLKHPNIKLFVTQGGLQSTEEAIAAGVPLIGIPMLGDQWYNVEKYVHHKIGLNLELDTLTEEKFRNAINNVISDKGFKRNIEELHRLMRDQMQPPLDRAVWWTEYVLRHGGAKHLRAPAANISWAEYFELELVLTLLLFLLGTIIAFVFIMYFLFRLVSSQSRKIKIN